MDVPAGTHRLDVETARRIAVNAQLFEYGGVIRPMDDLPLLLPRMAAAPRYQ